MIRPIFIRIFIVLSVFWKYLNLGFKRRWFSIEQQSTRKPLLAEIPFPYDWFRSLN